MTENQMKQFANKVAEMREAQKEYFRTRDYDDLQIAISLEREIDSMLMDMGFQESYYGKQ